MAQTITFTQPATPAACLSTFAIAPTAGPGLTVTPSGGCSMAGNSVTVSSGTLHCALTGGALARNVFWWLGNSATPGTGTNGSQWKENILVLTTIKNDGSGTLNGRVRVT